MKIYLVRHGETTGDIEDRIGGSYDDHLTSLGREQLAKTAQKLADKNIEIIFSSPLVRARESAQIIQQAIGSPIEIVDGFRERHYGVITGMLKSEAKAKYPEAIERHSDLTYTHPDGESYPDFYQRVVNAFASVTNENDRTMAIIGHGGSLKCILKELKQPIPDKLEDGHIIELDCCSAEGCC
ncbi:MAG TPA: histidine phosphatase family protein [Alphaproteobacteria bacterium]